ncbi:hypothetical protein, partial [Phaeodactylibacter xiamenensis]|uniref:hypothetical protein n=1 Tax=Phaeodactylibacter xiamenensis TaxID=1524460 RepID=UPI0024A8559A
VGRCQLNLTLSPVAEYRSGAFWFYSPPPTGLPWHYRRAARLPLEAIPSPRLAESGYLIRFRYSLISRSPDYLSFFPSS